MKTILTTMSAAGLLLAGVATATPAVAASPFGQVRCEVKSLQPEWADFFTGLLSQPPVVGDVIALDLGASEIADLTFESGNAIPLARVHAKLVRDANPEDDDYHANFAGTYRSPTSDYTGVLDANLQDDAGNLSVSVQVLRHYFDGPLVLHTLQMDCAPRS